jgi:hypothetical protein
MAEQEALATTGGVHAVISSIHGFFETLKTEGRPRTPHRQRKAGQSKCYRETCYERLLLLALDFLLLMTMSCAKSVEVEIR